MSVTAILFYGTVPERDAVIEALHPLLGYPTIAQYDPPIPPAPHWWEKMKTKGRVKLTQDSIGYAHPNGQDELRYYKAGAEMQYWNEEQNGYLLVFRGTFELWIPARHLTWVDPADLLV